MPIKKRMGIGGIHLTGAKRRAWMGCWGLLGLLLKNISQWEGLSHILWKIKNV